MSSEPRTSVITPRPGDPNRTFVVPSRISQRLGSIHIEISSREEKFFQAAYSGDLEQVKMFLYQRIDHGIRHPSLAMSTPLHLAVLAGQSKCVEYLIDRGACPYVVNAFGKSPMDYAMENKDMLRTIMLSLQIREQTIRRLRERNVNAKEKEKGKDRKSTDKAAEDSHKEEPEEDEEDGKREEDVTMDEAEQPNDL
jgi:ankyrin repeat protein